MAKSKKEMYAEVSELVARVLSANSVDAGVQEQVQQAIDHVLKPGVFGSKTDIESVVKRDGEGNIVELKCSLSGVFLPATPEYFYEDKSGKSQFNGLKRLSKKAEKARKQHAAAVAKAMNKINQSLYAGAIDVETAKAEIAAVQATKPDFSTVTA